MTAAPDPKAKDYRPNEWKEARSVVDAADTRLTDLRKYGLTFVAGLLTAQGLTEVAVGTPASFVTPIVKLGITAVSLLIICMMVAIERVNLPVQRAAAIRATVLERQLGLELTSDITKVYDWYNAWRWVFGLYMMFVVSVGLFGLAILMPISFNVSWEVPVEIVAFGLGSVFVALVLLRTPEVTLIDWSLDRYRCTHGDPPLLLMVTNFMSYDISADTDFELWRVEGTPENVPLNALWQRDDKPLSKGESRMWAIDTSGLPVGFYNLLVARPKGELKKVTVPVLTSTGSPELDEIGRPRTKKQSIATFDHLERLPVPLAVMRSSDSHAQIEVIGDALSSAFS